MITIDGRGLTPTEAVRDLWMRMQPLTQKGYNPISEVEIIDTKTKEVVEHFLVTDPEFELHTRQDARKAAGEMTEPNEHKPPTPHEYPYVARLSLE